MSTNSNDIVVGSIQTLGDHQFKIIRQIGEGRTGFAYKAYLMKEGAADESRPFAIKVDKSDYFLFSEYRIEKLLEKRQKEAQKQSQLFESEVYRIGNRIVTLMPLLPGQPILDEHGWPHPQLANLKLSERLGLAALVVQTYLEFHAERADREGFFHVDLHWNNVLIYIEKINGKACIQCNILDFTNNSKYVLLIGAPEYKFSLFSPTPSIKSDTYSLTFLIAIILGETDVFKYKYPYRTGGKAAELPFHLKGMESYLRKEFYTLSNNKKAQDPMGVFADSADTSQIPGTIIDEVIDIVMRMGSAEPKNRPEESEIVKVLLTASLACCKMEMEIEMGLTENDLTTKIIEVGVKEKKEFYNEPIRNHLLVETGIGMWAKPNLRVENQREFRRNSAFTV